MSDSGAGSHRAAAPEAVGVAVLTVSDTRTAETDTSGDYLAEQVAAAGHRLVDRGLVRDDPEAIRARLEAWLADAAVQVVLTSGGTGITRRDTTIRVVEALLDKPLPGFGELFRMLSFREVGAAAILSAATGGLARGTLVFALPGSRNAVRTAWEGLLGAELAHLVFEATR